MPHLWNPYSRLTASLFSYLGLGNALKYSDASAIRCVGQVIFHRVFSITKCTLEKLSYGKRTNLHCRKNWRRACLPEEGDTLWKGWGCSVENLNLTPKKEQPGCDSSFIWPLKGTTLSGIGSITRHCSGREPKIVDKPQETSRKQA